MDGALGVHGNDVLDDGVAQQLLGRLPGRVESLVVTSPSTVKTNRFPCRMSVK